MAKQTCWPGSFAASQQRSIRTSVSFLDAIDVKVPAMGESVSEGTIASILKKAGEPIIVITMGSALGSTLHARPFNGFGLHLVCMPAALMQLPSS